MLTNYEPSGDREDPKNSAYLLPLGLRGHAKGLDREEFKGAKNGWRMNECRKHLGALGVSEVKKSDIRDRLYKGINNEEGEK